MYIYANVRIMAVKFKGYFLAILFLGSPTLWRMVIGPSAMICFFKLIYENFDETWGLISHKNM